MACLTSAQDAITIAGGLVAAAKGTYDSSLSSLRSLNPGSFSTREQFEAAKNSAISTVQGTLNGYVGSISVLNGAAGVLGAINGGSLDELANTNGAALMGLLAIIPGAPSSLGVIDAAVIAQKALQCLNGPTPPLVVPE